MSGTQGRQDPNDMVQGILRKGSGSDTLCDHTLPKPQFNMSTGNSGLSFLCALLDVEPLPRHLRTPFLTPRNPDYCPLLPKEFPISTHHQMPDTIREKALVRHPRVSDSALANCHFNKPVSE